MEIQRVSTGQCSRQWLILLSCSLVVIQHCKEPAKMLGGILQSRGNAAGVLFSSAFSAAYARQWSRQPPPPPTREISWIRILSARSRTIGNTDGKKKLLGYLAHLLPEKDCSLQHIMPLTFFFFLVFWL